MLDRFMLNQRWLILSLTLLLFLIHSIRHFTIGTTPTSNAWMLLLAFGFCLYNALFLANWHHLSERLIHKVQRLRSHLSLPSLPRKRVWLQQKTISLINLVLGSTIMVAAMLGLATAN
ncbi:MAG: hypothetical protein RLZZ511_1233 [Cyanobacteriota bacterium]|jgi:uncharacterized membrane protein YbhN (UPF0104 family)